ncbi:triacylglycerol esterase/lipase EstA (alpha/beta hydrolase family) [Actinoplanes octamycinicus]|uniref:Triacylglycerol esterase/lipase EstA (Alpha/beta hydrolase family) n=1 Tax=Actinoplanes octamycinicus TaxID=135948 RepID=A0A7W7H0M2_9ACTN|nr:lipase [Actinoplanes octamycinicus]MBB4741577.1 triacylglycerol esterase/lipase EstA (alpha/beta hydrolase family) [Actinoplanes octamycinicus]GIE57129.1 lipase [Actinoplanes octamycinicus]
MSPRRRALLLGVACLVAVAVLAGLTVRWLRDGDDGPRPDQARPGTVLLVPGYGGSRTALTRLAQRIEAAGRTARVLTLPGEGDGDLLQQAQVLDVAVREALRAGAPSVDVVGYSAGGVVTRLWVDRHAGAEVARRVVTLGSPLHGARLAGLGAALAPGSCPAACRQLAPGSDLLRDLDEPLPDGLPWLSIWTENDETVQPPDSARLDGAINLSLQQLCPAARVAHSQLPTDPDVTALVLAALSPAPLTTPTTCPD